MEARARVTVNLDSLAWVDTLESDLAACLDHFAGLIVAAMRELAREDTGAMKASARHELAGLAAHISVGEGLPDARAIYNEHGTTRMSAQPMLAPAFAAHVPPFLDAVEALMTGRGRTW